MMSIVQAGTLFVVATPIGNMDDITDRAKQVLGSVDVILAEDTRHSGRLLKHYGIKTPMRALHEHNERDQVEPIIEKLCQGKSMALISDAGTPLISDPGYHIVRKCHENNIQVSPLPGAAACIVALSVSGLPTDRFCFEGFLPAKAFARAARLETLVNEVRTMVFYESSHRVLACLKSMRDVFGNDRQVTLARELSKRYETIKSASLGILNEWILNDENQQRGEFVIVVAGQKNPVTQGDEELKCLLKLLMGDLSIKQSANIAAKYFLVSKKHAYQQALELQGKGSVKIE